jgi:hypothetical protein
VQRVRQAARVDEPQTWAALAFAAGVEDRIRALDLELDKALL